MSMYSPYRYGWNPNDRPCENEAEHSDVPDASDARARDARERERRGQRNERCPCCGEWVLWYDATGQV